MNIASVVILALFLLAFVAAIFYRLHKRGSCCGCEGGRGACGKPGTCCRCGKKE